MSIHLRTWRSRGKRPRPDLEARSEQQCMESFLEAITCSRITSTELNIAQITYLNHVVRQLHAIPARLLLSIVTHDDKATSIPLSSLFHLMEKVANLCGSQGPDEIIRILVTDKVVQERCLTDKILLNTTRYLILTLLGIITMLYVPTPLKEGTQNHEVFEVQPMPQVESNPINLEYAERPLGEVLISIGQLLPDWESMFLEPKTGSNPLFVSYLNVSTLTTIGRITIDWVDTIGCHLKFDIATRRLSLFRMPSFCLLHSNSLDSVTQRVLQNYYSELDLPYNLEVSARSLHNQILLSYRLLFGDHYQSRRIYRHWKLDTDTTWDQTLDDLCGGTGEPETSTANWVNRIKDSYNAEDDFPYLGPRLLKLQDFILSREPDKLKALWHDQRDMSRWWTFWAVVFFGGFGVIIGLVQVALAAAQVRLAMPPIELNTT